MRLKISILAIALCALSSRAEAAPIGSFEWVHETLFGTGSTFVVTNTSSDPFQDVFVDLYAPGATTPFFSASLGDVGAGSAEQSTDDLSFLIVPSDIDRAVSRLTYLSESISVELSASSLQGDPVLFLTGSVQIPEPTTAVPEPSSLALFSVSLGAVSLATRRRMRRDQARPV